jgi:diadenosine tetraphosphate (Ap4A) HIT family hydrolase
MNDWKQDRIGSAERGENPMVLARMRSGFAVIGDTQFLPGYSLLLASPQVDHLTDLSFTQRGLYLQDMTLIGEAIMQVCQPRRINYEILGNTDHFLHAHIFPRYSWEPAERQGSPVWLYPHSHRDDPNLAYSDEKNGELRQQLTEVLLTLMRSQNALPE